MLEIIHQRNFRRIPWKNGQGTTIELAISEHGTVDDFDWRLSIATVDKDGLFSDFSGYTRNLVLIDGRGLLLEHAPNRVDRLAQFLEYSTFDGASKTKATLLNGPITDFNLMTKTKKFEGRLQTFAFDSFANIEKALLSFVYALDDTLTIHSKISQSNVTLEQGELAKIIDIRSKDWVVSGSNFILIYIDHT